MNQYELAIFDMDGVLTETSEQHYRAWKVLADELGLKFDKEMNEELKGISRMASFEVILRENDKSDAYFDYEKEKLINKKNEIYKEMIDHITPDQLFEGVSELFTHLKSQGIKIALASASKNSPTLLKKLGIAEDFDFVVNPADIPNGKPAPDIFLAAAAALGVSPINCIGFEDAVAGVHAIKSAGMYAVGIGDADQLGHADLVYDHIREVDRHILMGLQ